MDRKPIQPSQPNPNADKFKLDFRPVNDGLGFHPFSDGLPYAPGVKRSQPVHATSQLSSGSQLKNRVNGTGATVAGPVQMSRTPVVQATHGVQVTGSKLPIHSAVVVPQPSLPQSSPRETEQGLSLGIGYCLRRMIAYGIDLVMNTFLLLLALVALVWSQESSHELISSGNTLFMLCGVWLVFQWFVTTLEEVVFKTTFGKMMVGLSLRGSRGHLLLRALLFILGFCFFGLGILCSVLDPKKRCWHDRMVGVQPS